MEPERDLARPQDANVPWNAVPMMFSMKWDDSWGETVRVIRKPFSQELLDEPISGRMVGKSTRDEYVKYWIEHDPQAAMEKIRRVGLPPADSFYYWVSVD